MRGSRIAKNIEADMRREKFWKSKAVRKKCIIDKQKQCNKCAYRKVCEDVEIDNIEEDLK